MNNPQISFWWFAPFALILLAIALLPLFAGHWWEKNRNKFFLSLLIGAPVLVYFLFFVDHGTHYLLHSGHEYLSFVVLLAALYTVSGGIFVGGDLRATPLVNSAFLLGGSLLASFVGTTGASMVLIYPLLNTNAERKHRMHTVIFFIFLVSNIGGCLTPLGDPPLFMGYLMGVPFTWTFSLWRGWALCVAIVLAIYFIIDSILYRREPLGARAEDEWQQAALYVRGWLSVVLLCCIVAAVALVQKSPWRELILAGLAVISYAAGNPEYRRRNAFSFHPILEVAAVFLGIFITLVPAIILLREHAGDAGITQAWQFFWATGLFSAFLDNTPTYVVFFNLAQSMNLGSEIVGMPQNILKAISYGAVFFGALTYIGNAPNFMVRSIAESKGVKMPSFGTYLLYSSLVLLPVFWLLSYLWC